MGSPYISAWAAGSLEASASNPPATSLPLPGAPPPPPPTPPPVVAVPVAQAVILPAHLRVPVPAGIAVASPAADAAIAARLNAELLQRGRRLAAVGLAALPLSGALPPLMALLALAVAACFLRGPRRACFGAAAGAALCPWLCAAAAASLVGCIAAFIAENGLAAASGAKRCRRGEPASNCEPHSPWEVYFAWSMLLGAVLSLAAASLSAEAMSGARSLGLAPSLCGGGGGGGGGGCCARSRGARPALAQEDAVAASAAAADAAEEAVAPAALDAAPAHVAGAER